MSDNEKSGWSTTDYVINVKTSDRFGAGTDAKVFIQLFGDKGNSDPMQLKHSNKSNKFERDQMDQFTFFSEISKGNLKSIRIWHDNTGLAAGWHLEFVEICDTGSGLKYRFPCHRWLSTDDDDGVISRDLKCFEVTSGPSTNIFLGNGPVLNSQVPDFKKSLLCTEHTVQKANGIPKKSSTASIPDTVELAETSAGIHNDIVPTKVIEVHSPKPSPTLTVYGPYSGHGSPKPERRKGSGGEIKSLYGKYHQRERSGSSHSAKSLNINFTSLNIN